MEPGQAALPSDAAIGRAMTDVFGFERLRPGQADVIRDVLAGRHVVTVMPTGAGKSLCYQLPAVMLRDAGGVALVVSPLIALMKDQVDALRARGVEAAALTSAVGPAEQDDILAGIRASVFSLVYVAPERFRSGRFLDALAQMGDRLALLAVDEAHCISEWGHEFRPDYRRLGEAVARLRPPRLIALTATATPEVREDIAIQLRMAEPRFHVRGFDRPNLHFAVERAGGPADKSARLVEKVRTRTGGTALVYAATRKNAERYAEALAAAGMRIRVYHAGLDDGARTSAQDEFMAGKLDAIVATNAFGMGVDKDDIRLVVHADLPRSPEAYYQESGRGGRDGRTTDCVLLFNHSDARLQEFLIDSSYPSAELLRGLWKVVREDPELSASLDRLRVHLPGEPHAAAVRSAIRTLVRTGFLREEGPLLAAVRPPEPSRFPPLDVEALARRADIERDKLRTMIEYAYYPRCRRQFVLDYFGDADWVDRGRRCTACDNCKGLHSTRALNEAEAFCVRGLLALVARLSGRFGRTRLAGLANGTDDDARFVELPERGVLRGQSTRYVLELLRALEGAGLVEVSREQYPTVSITRQGRRVVSEELAVEDAGVMVPDGGVKAKRSAKPMRTDDVMAGLDDDPGAAVTAERLRRLRTELAGEKAVPPYVIFSNRTLEAIARSRPRTEQELAAVPGIGPSRLEAYGARILSALREDG